MTSGETGGDVDLVCRVPEFAALRRTLGKSGFQPRGRRLPRRAWTEQWVRFCDGAPQVVDLNPAQRWGVSPGTIERLFQDGVQVAAWTRPAAVSTSRADPAGAAARSWRGALVRQATAQGRPLAGRGRWRLGPRGRDRGRMALPIGATGVATATRGRRPYGRSAPTCGPGAGAAGTPARGAVAAGPSHRSVPRRPMVIGVSGVDGSGKSTQIAALRTTLAELGVPADVAWKPVGHGHALRFVRRTVKRLLGASPTGPAPVQAENAGADVGPQPRQPPSAGAQRGADVSLVGIRRDQHGGGLPGRGASLPVHREGAHLRPARARHRRAPHLPVR